MEFKNENKSLSQRNDKTSGRSNEGENSESDNLLIQSDLLYEEASKKKGVMPKLKIGKKKRGIIGGSKKSRKIGEVACFEAQNNAKVADEPGAVEKDLEFIEAKVKNTNITGGAEKRVHFDTEPISTKELQAKIVMKAINEIDEIKEDNAKETDDKAVMKNEAISGPEDMDICDGSEGIKQEEEDDESNEETGVSNDEVMIVGEKISPSPYTPELMTPSPYAMTQPMIGGNQNHGYLGSYPGGNNMMQGYYYLPVNPGIGNGYGVSYPSLAAEYKHSLEIEKNMTENLGLRKKRVLGESVGSLEPPQGPPLKRVRRGDIDVAERNKARVLYGQESRPHVSEPGNEVSRYILDYTKSRKPNVVVQPRAAEEITRDQLMYLLNDGKTTGMLRSMSMGLKRFIEARPGRENIFMLANLAYGQVLGENRLDTQMEEFLSSLGEDLRSTQIGRMASYTLSSMFLFGFIKK